MNRVENKVFEFFDCNMMDKYFVKGNSIQLHQLNDIKVFSEFVYANTAIKKFVETHKCTSIALFGWIDQAILEVDYAEPFSSKTYEECLIRLDIYSPDQGGDMVFLIAESNWSSFIAVEFSSDRGDCDVSVYNRLSSNKNASRDASHP